MALGMGVQPRFLHGHGHWNAQEITLPAVVLLASIQQRLHQGRRVSCEKLSLTLAFSCTPTTWKDTVGMKLTCKT